MPTKPTPSLLSAASTPGASLRDDGALPPASATLLSPFPSTGPFHDPWHTESRWHSESSQSVMPSLSLSIQSLQRSGVFSGLPSALHAALSWQSMSAQSVTVSP